ncbi:MAG: DNA-processing protein DprA [Acidobacteria bacterium]|nr:DNA-processing protein DprA [Acidobacteriota bacterium]
MREPAHAAHYFHMASAGPALTREEELYWIALHLSPGLGPRKAQLLLAHFRTPQAIFRASKSELEATGLSGSVAQTIASGCGFEDAAIQQQRMLDAGARLVTFGAANYSARLRAIFDPPVALFVRGEVALLNSVCVAMVGTRRASSYGLAASERLSRELAEAGLTIVSGMARGIDTQAHQAALDAPGNTIAVFGCGVDVIYPAENRKLAEQIAERGLLVSEFAMGSPGYPQNFPIRNRIVSGLSTGVIVVEGAQYSGSAITAKLASDQGREVFAVPGNITSKMSWAPNLLIKQGAKLVQEWNDVVAELSSEDRRQLASRQRQQLLALDPTQPVADMAVPGAEVPTGPLQQQLLSKLEFDKAAHLDHLMEVLEGTSSSEVIATLFELELLGMVRQLPGRNFIKVWVD